MSTEIIETKVIYFIGYWRDFTYKNSIEKELSHTIIYNPQELFKEFADEIERKQLKNKDNKKFFMDSINQFSDLPIESIKFLKTTLSLIKQQFQKQNFQYLLHLLSEIDKLLSTHQLGLDCVEELEQILTNNDELNNDLKAKIKILTKLIIFALINKNYYQKSIDKIIKHIFSGYQIIENRIATYFPHNIKNPNWDFTSSEFKEYQDKLQDFLDNLTLNQRLLAIKNYFLRKPEKLTYIFQIKGLKGDIDILFGNVKIYNPKNVRLIKNQRNELSNELFNSEHFIYYNGAVTLDVIDCEYAKYEAMSILS